MEKPTPFPMPQRGGRSVQWKDWDLCWGGGASLRRHLYEPLGLVCLAVADQGKRHRTTWENAHHRVGNNVNMAGMDKFYD